MKGEKYMKSIKHYDDFTDVLNRMNNDDFALFLTGYPESIGRNIQLLPIHIDKFDCLAWVGYFTENGGLNGDDENRFIVSEILKNAIDCLKEQQKLVISLYYYERLKFSDIAKVMDVSESRICQIHSKAMLNLRYSLEKYIKQ